MTDAIARDRRKAVIKIQQLPQGQLIVSIPQTIGVAHDLKKGQEIVWKADGKRLYMELVQ
jgi:hypothetical protein